MRVQTGTERAAKGSAKCECRLERREQQKVVQNASADWNGESSKRRCNMRVQTGTERAAKDGATRECRLERREQQKTVQHASSYLLEKRRKYAKKLLFLNILLFGIQKRSTSSTNSAFQANYFVPALIKRVMPTFTKVKSGQDVKLYLLSTPRPYYICIFD